MSVKPEVGNVILTFIVLGVSVQVKRVYMCFNKRILQWLFNLFHNLLFVFMTSSAVHIGASAYMQRT